MSKFLKLMKNGAKNYESRKKIENNKHLKEAGAGIRHAAVARATVGKENNKENETRRKKKIEDDVFEEEFYSQRKLTLLEMRAKTNV